MGGQQDERRYGHLLRGSDARDARAEQQRHEDRHAGARAAGPELDVFDGIVIATEHGLRFIDADHVGEITRSQISTSITDTEAASLPAPGGPPIYRVDALDDTGSSLHDRLGRLFGRPHWIREHD
jgi:hypothetical protein